jgi:hypothetical protein
MLHALAITNEQDILAIHNVVSKELQTQIEEAYPHLFRKQFDFSFFFNQPISRFSFPFFAGNALCDNEEDRNKCLIVHHDMYVELGTMKNGAQILRFFNKVD